MSVKSHLAASMLIRLVIVPLSGALIAVEIGCAVGGGASDEPRAAPKPLTPAEDGNFSGGGAAARGTFAGAVDPSVPVGGTRD